MSTETNNGRSSNRNARSHWSAQHLATMIGTTFGSSEEGGKVARSDLSRAGPCWRNRCAINAGPLVRQRTYLQVPPNPPVCANSGSKRK